MLDTVNPITTGIRLMFISLDLGIYYLLRFIYELFFNIATFNILDRRMIFDIFSRIQLIVGIFMMFQLVMLIIKGIVNPDTVSDSKSGGAGSIIMRIIVSLALLALIIPINIPSPRNEYEKQVRNNGVLFGTLYSLQYRVLSNNTLGRLILGNDDTDYTSPDSSNQALSHFADEFSTTIAKTFYTLNMGEDGQKYVCGDGWDKTYNQTKTPFIIVAAGARQCNLIGTKYSLSMSYLIGTVAVAVLVIVMFMMCFEVAKRVFQLAALQLIAPVPIISYMDPNGSKDGAFSSWVKLLVSTYTELFVRLAVIYFSLGVINKFSEKFFSAETALSTTTEVISGAAGNAPQIIKWTFIIMCIGLFIFAKDAPKFFKQMLGIKSDKKFFDSFGQALGVGAVAAGAVSGGVSGAVSRYQNADPSMNKAQKVMEAIKGGTVGALKRGAGAMNEYMNSKDGGAAGILRGNRANAEQNWKDAENKSKFIDTASSKAAANFGLKDKYQKLQDHVDSLENANSAFGRVQDALTKDGKKNGKYTTLDFKNNSGNGFTLDNLGMATKDSSGNTIDYSLKDLNDHLQRMKTAGESKEKQEAMEGIIKQATRIRSQEIAHIGDAGGAGFSATANGGTRDITGETVYQDIQIMWKNGKKNENDDDGVFAYLKTKTKSEEMFSDKDEYAKTKTAFGSGAKGRKDNITTSTEYQDAKNAHERANKKTGS